MNTTKNTKIRLEYTNIKLVLLFDRVIILPMPKFLGRFSMSGLTTFFGTGLDVV